MLLEELAKKKNLNVDFHNHLQTGSVFRKKPKGFKERIKNLFIEEGFSDLAEILNRIFKTDLDVLYISNFSDSRAEDWTSEEQLQIARRAGYEIEQRDYYTFAKKDDRVIALGKSQEVPTTQGHTLFSGLKRDKKFTDKKSLDKTLKEVDDNELKIADHPYFRIKIKEENGVMAYSENPEKDAKKFDALEKNGNFSPVSFPFSIANYLAKKASKKYNIPLVANSDGHHPKEIGKTYNIFDSKNLDYTSEKAFRDSINSNVRKNKFSYRFSPTPPWRVFHHVLMFGIYNLAKKFHLIKKETFEKYSAE